MPPAILGRSLYVSKIQLAFLTIHHECHDHETRTRTSFRKIGSIGSNAMNCVAEGELTPFVSFALPCVSQSSRDLSEQSSRGAPKTLSREGHALPRRSAPFGICLRHRHRCPFLIEKDWFVGFLSAACVATPFHICGRVICGCVFVGSCVCTDARRKEPPHPDSCAWISQYPRKKRRCCSARCVLLTHWCSGWCLADIPRTG